MSAANASLTDLIWKPEFKRQECVVHVLVPFEAFCFQIFFKLALSFGLLLLYWTKASRSVNNRERKAKLSNTCVRTL
jgi:hypothetical protein